MKEFIRAITLILFSAAIAFSEDTYRSEMGKANEALGKKDYQAYLSHMKRAVELEPDKVSRPFYQYALARAYAYNDQLPKSLETLETLYNEGIEAPMIFIAVEDPAFKKFLNDPAFQKLQKKNETHTITLTSVKGNIYMIEGAGCFLAASIGNDGVLLVDSGYPQLNAQIISALNAKSGNKPVRRIINTHEHMDHVGGNAAMRKDAVVIAHANVRSAITKPSEYFSDFSVQGMPENQWPDLVFDDELSLFFNGEEIRVIGLPAHSEGDSIVYFANSHVLHMGDNYFPGGPRYLYPGTHIKEYFDVFGPFIKTLPNDATVMSGHAKPVPIADLRAIYNKTESMYSFVQNQIQQGKNFEESKSLAEKDGYPADWLEFYFKNLTKNKTEENQ
jgi:glyoxylase-like metal-dependent hydrolase (beta-lactamase superfamily II)